MAPERLLGDKAYASRVICHLLRLWGIAVTIPEYRDQVDNRQRCGALCGRRISKGGSGVIPGGSTPGSAGPMRRRRCGEAPRGSNPRILGVAPMGMYRLPIWDYDPHAGAWRQAGDRRREVAPSLSQALTRSSVLMW